MKGQRCCMICNIRGGLNGKILTITDYYMYCNIMQQMLHCVASGRRRGSGPGFPY
jgi:hypothetical protein